MPAVRDAVAGLTGSAADFLGQVQAGVLVLGRSGLMEHVNPKAAALFGRPGRAADLVGEPLSALGIEPRDVSLVQRMTGQVLRGRPWLGTVSVRQPDGCRTLARLLAVPVQPPGGKVCGITILAREASRLESSRERDRIALLESIGERLARSLELDVTLRHVAETLVPQFADHCLIDLFHGDTLVRQAMFHAGGWTPEPGSWALVGEQISYPEGHFCQQALERMETVLVAELAGEAIPVPRPESKQICDDIGLRSVIAAPLIVRGQPLGVMSLALSGLTKREGGHYNADDRDFLGAVASRVAVAIDNAILFEEERRTALAFQHSLLPHDPPELDGLEVAYKYVPAKPLETHGQGIQTQVGGDWYDIIPLSAGRVGIVIGDVEGRGARAAATMGQLRAALRAFAQDDEPPAEVLRRLDDWCRVLEPQPSGGDGAAAADPPIVSCTYLVYDAWSRTLSFANAGHDAPLLITGSDVRQLKIEHTGVLLGVRGKGLTGVPTFREESRQLPPGAALVLYTDGLTDRRQRPDGGHYAPSEAQRMLCEAVRSVAGKGVRDIAEAAENAVPGEIDDDMAIVVMRTATTDLAWVEQTFPAEPIRVSDARRLAYCTFTNWGMDAEQAGLACLLVSEVATNVVLHAMAAPCPRHELPADPDAFPLAAVRQGAGGQAGHPGSGYSVEPDGRGVLAVDGAGSARTAGTAAALGAFSDDWTDAPLADDPPAQPGREFTLRLRRGRSNIWAEVFDPDLRLPRIRAAGENDEGGRGLYLVDQLASRWGSRPTRDGKAVWFELPLRESAPGG
jgi:serine phosphatase RsbU (regulator of sigma subunit)